MAFQVPDAVQEAVDLTAPAMAKATQIQPEDLVICINRGRQPLTDTFDGRHVPIPVGFFIIEFAAALHFQRRLIVPGTRTLADNGYVSYIGILGTKDGRIRRDTDEYCTPFTDEQLLKFGERVEGLDREAAGLPEVERRSTGAVVAATMRSTGPHGRPSVDVTAQATDAARDAVRDVVTGYRQDGTPLTTPAILLRTGESAAREAENEAEGDGLERPSVRRRR